MNFTSATIDSVIVDSGEDVRNLQAEASKGPVSIAITQDTPDIELTRLSAEGNLEAFEMLYQKYHRRAYSLCLRMTNNASEAEDLTQEAFIQLFRKAGSFCPECLAAGSARRKTSPVLRTPVPCPPKPPRLNVAADPK